MVVSEFYRQIFGCKTYKISLDAGCTCPNRDGKVGVGGCIFCNGMGSGDFAVRGTDVRLQVEQAKLVVAAKVKTEKPKYITYFQSFTNTYGDLEDLKLKWKTALSCEGVIGLALGTRPDCLYEACIKVLSKIAKNHFVQIELGLQTTNPKTVEYIRRGYKNEVYDQTMKTLAGKGFHVVTHIIFGLPGDTKQDMLETVQHAVEQKTDGIKITCLYISKNTDLAVEYEKGLIHPLEKEEYYDLLKQALKIIPPQTVIHRLTGDPSKKDVIAPLWTCDKKRVMNEIKKLTFE